MTQGPIRTALDADGVLLATIDMAGRTMNVFSVELMDALDTLMDRVNHDPAVRSCVITSGKPSFVAGADLIMVRGFCDSARTSNHEQMFEMCGRLGRQFVRMEAAAKPFVAAVNGLALGGGLELSLACRARLVADDPKLQLGVPEVRWGLLPGAGGTQRLPRLAGFAPAMDMLLTGRSIDPATALKLKIASELVPADMLIERAKACARSLHGTAYDEQAKFPNLAQADVPPYSDHTARAVAQRNGVTVETFDLYPAYGAIVDSVLKGARLPLAEASALEMNQFLRLMFNPVAGRMVRTLFLERLRAERELAAPAGTTIASLRVGPISETRRAWTTALSRLKLPQEADASLPVDTIEAVDGAGATHGAALRVLEEPVGDAAATQLVLAPQGPYGRVLECVGAPAFAAGVWAFLGARLYSVPWSTPGPASRLQALRGKALREQADIASRWSDSDPAFTDVAACLAGVSPAWSGGPLSWLAEQSQPA